MLNLWHHIVDLFAAKRSSKSRVRVKAIYVFVLKHQFSVNDLVYFHHKTPQVKAAELKLLECVAKDIKNVFRVGSIDKSFTLTRDFLMRYRT